MHNDGMGNIFGTFGALLFILSYFFVQKDKHFAKTLTYSAMNLSGAAFMLVSVSYDWNMGAVINNSFWIVLSIYGLWDFYRQSKDVSEVEPITVNAEERN